MVNFPCAQNPKYARAFYSRDKSQGLMQSAPPVIIHLEPPADPAHNAMNITRENFEDSFETIRDAIRASHFVAVDSEFTGLRVPGMGRERATNSVKARYRIARASCSTFMITQYGLSCFRYDDNGRLEARPFNAFISPSTFFGADRVFSCQASSMEFLSNHGFDFQAWAAHGVPFLSRAQEASIQEKMEARWARVEAEAAEAMEVEENSSTANSAVLTARDGTTMESLNEADRCKVLEAQKKVELLLAEGVNDREYVERSVELGPMTSRMRWLMYEFVGGNNPAIKLSNLSGPPSAKGMKIRTVCKDAKIQALAEAKAREDAKAREMESLKKAVGFRRVIDELSASGKPVITHNGLLDLFHTYDKFVGPLPTDYEEGTKAIHAVLPNLVDSKVVMKKAMEEGLSFSNTSLGDAMRWLREKFPAPDQTAKDEELAAPVASVADGAPQENGGVVAGNPAAEGGIDDKEQAERKRRAWDAVFAPGFEERYTASAQEHEAGYDAYLTGCCFVAAATVGLGVGVDEIMGMSSGRETPAALASLSNSVPLYKMLGGRRLSLPGPTPPLDTSRYVHVSGFPSAAKTDAVMRPLKDASECDWFHWIDDSSGVAECPSAEAAQALLQAAASASPAASVEAAGGDPPPEVNPTKLSLSDMKVVQLDPSMIDSEEDSSLEEKRDTKRPRKDQAKAEESVNVIQAI